MTEKTFNLPDVGEGLTEADIVQWKVQPGDTVAVNDVIVEIETAKSLVELPSPYAGTVSALMVAEGETVDVGTPIISVTVGAPGAASAPAPAGPAASAPAAETGEAPAASLTGTGPKPDAVRRRERRRPASPAAPAAAAAAETVAKAPVEAAVETAATAVQDRVNRLVQRVLAKPPVRKAAKDLGIDLAEVPATGASGEVTKQDLMGFQARRDQAPESAGTFGATGTGEADARIERIPVKGVRRATARAMVESAFSAPHASIFVDVDASRTMEFVKRLKASRDFEGIRVSPLLVLAKAVIWAAARNPLVNAAWAGDEILVKHYMNLGIAAATPRGLMVPNIKDAQDLSLKELAVALNNLTATAREGRTPPADMQGGTLTVTNLGSLGLDTGTPIINPGEVAIVAFGTIKQKPWVVDGAVVPRWVTTLGGSFDHRVVDGDLSARFIADVASILEEPALLLD
ncbi:2-oxo acid dehydrogenase subunit E2 [Arthrobacter sp. zg-Y20]|uniref:dihydrolipoamide acetyltransferase family protein n=1 Tax=unclassified Arthrobacter TaxID=235627 RepID=UPI001D14EFDC|nr:MULTISPECIES: dihydrolipoamide acetyltransferase family protein [unclassified Arthrobacter]MCC3275476.1 2-oxo acid dehydrogenase subunit E2 [Arthrobacter sp. zg-Y20]MDK1315633.1 dihydrolipoamide acetyltransferase family protein [Arthrobacter sp. zg.Y20]WIB06046.1 dihydrolipoamide acetyltransferase family protein [Arthrobacter sp. zg-Y20]